MYEKLIVYLYVEHIGGGADSCDVRDDTTVAERILQTCRICKTEKLLSAIALSVDQEINKTGT